MLLGWYCYCITSSTSQDRPCLTSIFGEGGSLKFPLLWFYRGIPDAGRFYPSYNGYKDELVWSSIWLYMATNETKYLTEAKSKYRQFRLNKYANQDFYWDDKLPGINVLLTKITRKKIYRTQAKKFCDNIIKQGKYTPKGLLYRRPWGTLQYSSGAALICLLTADLGIKSKDYRKFAKKQIDYILGDGGSRSFVVGYGPMPPNQPYHRSSSCPSAPNPCNFTALYSKEHNPHILYGAVVAGPDHKDHYVDDRSNTRSNRVSIAYNAAFQSAVAALKYLEIFPPPTVKPKTKMPKTTRKPRRKLTTTTATMTTATTATPIKPTTMISETSTVISANWNKPTNATSIPATNANLSNLTNTTTSDARFVTAPSSTIIVATTPTTTHFSDVELHNSTHHNAANHSDIATSPNSMQDDTDIFIPTKRSDITTVENSILATATPRNANDTMQDKNKGLSNKRCKLHCPVLIITFIIRLFS